MSEEIKKKIKTLAKKIVKASNDYYNSEPSVTDKLWDAWFDELKQLAPDHPVVTGVGAIPVSEWKKVQHETVMSSLNKVNTEDEFTIWVKNDCKSQKEYLGSEKLDGISVSVKYTNGKFEQALTRGNGILGEDISQNVKKMKGVIAVLNEDFTGHIRGEIILLKSDKDKYFSDYANPRNAASGIAKRLDGDGSEHLTVLFYKIDGKDFDTELQAFDTIKKLGLLTPNYNLLNTDGCLQMMQDYHDTIRKNLDYEIDGLVFTVNNCSEQYALGSKGRGPAGSIAFKFDAASAETIIRRIDWQVGATGRMTPVAIVDKVNIAGTTNGRASVYNLSYIQELGIGVGATVLLIKCNDVIPRVEEVVKPTQTEKAPIICPECGTATIRKGEYIICPNKADCQPQVLGRISTWINELGILEWGDKVIQKMINADLVQDIDDIYKLKPEQIADLDKMGERSAKVLLKELDKYREVNLYNLIGGLGIENVATSTAKLVISAGYNSLDALEKITIKELESIPGFGEIKAKAFYNGIRNNKTRIQNILDSGVKIKDKVVGCLTGMSFCFSGSSELPRKALHKIVEDNGGEVKKNVGKDLMYLVLADADSTSSKSVAAKKNGTQVISEEQFLKMAE